jgi:hypothetical protein
MEGGLPELFLVSFCPVLQVVEMGKFFNDPAFKSFPAVGTSHGELVIRNMFTLWAFH